ncbi:MAG: putative ABC transporter permease [Clostridiales bacterium]|nr:putative ABC transporter permease [Clostridiales bacterium]
MHLRTLEEYFIWFLIYSIIGWIYEVILCSYREEHFVNRGFLNGSYCPIYGFGALINIVLLHDIKNPILLFFTAGILMSILEYFTSWALEKIFHARWWDYSTYKFNLNGRIFLLGAIVFATLSVILMFLLHPQIERITLKIPDKAMHILSGVLFALFIADCVYTISSMTKFNLKLKTVTEHFNSQFKSISEYKNIISEKITNLEISEKLRSMYEQLKKFNNQERRMIKAFPKLKSIRYNDTLQKIKDLIHSKNK